jgi:molybdate transport system substrate-binding protein
VGSPAAAAELRVYAAESLTDAFNALKPEFERRHPGVQVRCNFGASSTLRVQIEQGAPADVFASADHAQMQPLVSARLVGSPQRFATNRLVVAIPATNPGKIRGVKDLARPGLRLVTTSEAVPIGRYTRQALEKLQATKGFPPDFARRVNANIVSREANVRGVLAKVELGEADAAIVYETDARSKRVRTLPIPENANVVAEYPVAIVTASRNPTEARNFVQFLLSPTGRALLKRHGFR